MVAQTEATEVNQILLVFTQNIQQEKAFQEIMDLFQSRKYQIVSYPIHNEPFEYMKLKEIIQEINVKYQGFPYKVAVMSNVKELLLLWYRIYNSLVDDFIYFIDGKKSVPFKGTENDDLLNALSGLVNINPNEVDGKIYINIGFDNYGELAEIMFAESNYQYFASLKYFGFHGSPKASRKINQYIYRDQTISFVEIPPEEKGHCNIISLDSQPISFFDERRFLDLFNYDIEFVAYYMCYLYKHQSPAHAFTICGNMLSYLMAHASAIKINDLQEFLYQLMDQDGMDFVQKGNLMSFVMLLRQNLQKLYFELALKWLQLINQKRSITGFFNRNAIRKIAIYAVTDLGKILYDGLVDSGVQVVCFIDKNAPKIKMYHDTEVVWLDRTDLLSDIDAVIITPVYDFGDIRDTVRKHLNNTRIISLKEVILES